MAKILIADDETNILDVMKDVLEEAGHDVVGVYDGDEAIRQLKNKRFDIAFIDVMMPKVDGYHVAAAVTNLPRRPKIVIVTARDFEADKNAILATGADAFLPKPFSNHELLEVVATLLENKK